MTNHPNRSKVDALRKVCHLAGIAVLETPRKGTATGQVRRSLLNEIEDALIAAGYDMKAARAKHDAAIKAQRDERANKRDANQVARVIGKRVEVGLYSRTTEHRLEKGTVIGPGKRDMVMVAWDEGEPSLISAHHLETI